MLTTTKFSVYKNGAANAGLAQNLHLDSFTFVYTEAASSTPSATMPWSDDFEASELSSDWTLTQAGDTDANWTLSTSRANSGSQSIFHDDANAATNGYNNWMITPTFDLSGATAPQLIYFDNVNYVTWAEEHNVLYSTDYSGDATTATWTTLNSTIGTEDTWVEYTYALPTESSVTVAFQYLGDYASEWYIDDVSIAEAPTEPAMEVSASTDGASATFSFTIDNFTVGAAGDTGVDGHIHYSLNGGSTVMVYSADDLTLSDLPNGDHSIVFELVDDAHASLDPAVTATVEFSTFDGTVACDGSLSHTYGNNESGVLFTSTNEGGTVTVTVTGSTESGYDYLIVRNGAGEVLYNASGDHTGQAITSEDGTLTVEVDSDGSVSGYTLDFAVTCGTLQANVTFTVNTANITVGENGMYLGGGVFGGATAHAMSDADGDGTWEVTVAMDPGTTGNYIFLNSPNSDSDWGTKENLEGQDCADPANYNDRILPEITGDMTIQHCFGSCESDGTCPAAAATYDVTFSVDMSNYPGGLGADDTVY